MTDSRDCRIWEALRATSDFTEETSTFLLAVAIPPRATRSWAQEVVVR